MSTPCFHSATNRAIRSFGPVFHCFQTAIMIGTGLVGPRLGKSPRASFPISLQQGIILVLLVVVVVQSWMLTSRGRLRETEKESEPVQATRPTPLPARLRAPPSLADAWGPPAVDSAAEPTPAPLTGPALPPQPVQRPQASPAPPLTGGNAPLTLVKPAKPFGPVSTVQSGMPWRYADWPDPATRLALPFLPGPLADGRAAVTAWRQGHMDWHDIIAAGPPARQPEVVAREVRIPCGLLRTGQGCGLLS